jgi:hypothetical protein
MGKQGTHSHLNWKTSLKKLDGNIQRRWQDKVGMETSLEDED